MSTSYTPAEQEILGLIRSLDQKVSGLDQKVSGLETEMGSMKSTMDAGFRRLEGLLLDTRDELRSESAASRTLLNQAFTHISDQLAHEETSSFVPKYPRTK